MFTPGNAFLFKDPGDPKMHLWFVVTEREGGLGEFVAVRMCTRKAYTDATLLLGVGDHPFIKHDSCIDYSTAMIFTENSIERANRKGRFQLKENADRKLLDRIKTGLLSSPHTIHWIRDYCEERF